MSGLTVSAVQTDRQTDTETDKNSSFVEHIANTQA